MRGGEVMKPGKSQKGSAQRHLNAGFVAGGLLMLLVYLVAQHFAVSAPHGNESFDPPSPWLWFLAYIYAPSSMVVTGILTRKLVHEVFHQCVLINLAFHVSDEHWLFSNYL
jgi:hypothetical protein